MAEKLYLINEDTGKGVDFEVLDRIRVGRKQYIVLLPLTAEDIEICSSMMEPLADDDEDSADDCTDVCILEIGESRNGNTQFLRVEDDVLDCVFKLFRDRNEERFQFV
ncbi:MAG: DUF1292 domain-containing protein [Firmicutes bacterium]|nr:DUF1292 domain-containing protein [Bacillota bacterium]